MGHGKETPRQRMIGMMYLMLTAMLALNVSKDILNAFVIVNESLEKTNDNFYKKNQSVYNQFEKAYQLNKAKVGHWKSKSDEVKKRADEIFNKVQELKYDIVKGAEGAKSAALGKEKEVTSGLIASKDNTDSPARIMVGESGNGEGKKLKKKIEEFRTFALSLIDKKDTALIRSINKSLDTQNPPPKEGAIHTWESEHFEHWPLIGVLTIMSGIQGNVRNAEAEMVNYLYNRISASDMKFNTIEATIIHSEFVVKGGEYKAKIFLAASDSTSSPVIVLGDYDSTRRPDGGYDYRMRGQGTPVEVKEGKGIVKKTASTAGSFRLKGLINLTAPDGMVISRPFNAPYQVSDAGVVVSPTKMNVFYVGLDNPVDISAPGIPPEKVEASITNGTISRVKGGSYMVKPSKAGNATVTVRSKVGGQVKNIGTKEFRIKTVPDPYPTVGGSRGGDMPKNVLAAQQIVNAELPDFLFDLKFKVVSFNMFTVEKGFLREIPAKSAQITEDQRALLRNLSVGQRVTFEQIKVQKPGGIVSDIGSVVFKAK